MWPSPEQAAARSHFEGRIERSARALDELVGLAALEDERGSDDHRVPHPPQHDPVLEAQVTAQRADRAGRQRDRNRGRTESRRPHFDLQEAPPAE